MKQEFLDKIINGKELSVKTLEALKDRIKISKTESESEPHLAIVMVGDNPASKIYVRNKLDRAKEVGIETSIYEFPSIIKENDLKFLIGTLNDDENVNGIIVQLPLPEQFNSDEIINLVSAEKDVDGFCDENQDALKNGANNFIIPATPLAVLEIINEVESDLNGKNICVVGKSKTVGGPIAQIFRNLGANVSVVDKSTENPQEITSKADILVSACGKAKMIKADWVKDDAVIIDVGITKMEDGKLSGDVDFDKVIEKVKHITPVPGGVGPMTIAMLLNNVVEAWKKQNKIEL